MPFDAVPVPVLAAGSPWMIYIVAVGLGVAILVRVLGWIWIKRIEEQFKRDYPDYWKRFHPEEPEPEDDGSGKRPGQFGIFDLLVLMTFAGAACAIVRLPIHFVLKMFAITAAWIGLYFWALGKPDARKFRSLAFKRRAAMLHAVGMVLVITPYCWYRYEQSARLPAAATAGFLLSMLPMLPMLLFPLFAIWEAGRAVRAEFAAGRSRKQRRA